MAQGILSIARDCEGASAIEYGLLATLIGAAAVVAMEDAGVSLAAVYDLVAAVIANSVATAAEQ